jgi:hypothetical protein
MGSSSRVYISKIAAIMATGSEQLFKSEATQKRELQLSPLSKYSEFGVYSMKKTGGRRRMFISSSGAS